MNSAISWLLEVQVLDGREDDFRALMEEMAGAAQSNEPGTLVYECYAGAEEKQFHLYERFVDSSAAMTHLGTFGEKYADRFLAVLKPERVFVYGSPSEALKGALAGFGPIYMKPASGFRR